MQHLLQIQPPSLLLDIGALDGKNAIAFAKSGVHRVYSFEPTPAKIPRIRDNLHNAGVAQNVTLFNLALANYSGETELWVQGGALGSPQDQLGKPKWKGGRKTTVRVDTLDNIVGLSDRVLYAKIDTQGQDPLVLLGAEALLRSRRLQYLAFEVWPGGSSSGLYSRAVTELHQLGYRCHDCARPFRRPTDGKAAGLPWSPLRQILQNLSETRNEWRGAQVGSWTNFVCFVPAGGSSIAKRLPPPAALPPVTVIAERVVC